MGEIVTQVVAFHVSLGSQARHEDKQTKQQDRDEREPTIGPAIWCYLWNGEVRKEPQEHVDDEQDFQNHGVSPDKKTAEKELLALARLSSFGPRNPRESPKLYVIYPGGNLLTQCLGGES